MFNISETAQRVSVDFATLNLKGKVAIRDLWKNSELGNFKKQYKQMINPHGAALFKLSQH